MAAITAPTHQGEFVHVPAWAFALLVLSLFGAYIVLQENGWIVSNWMTIHEFFHDGRHALGLPCH